MNVRAPYDWPFVLGFLQARATPGIELVCDGHYRRTLQIDGHSGEIDVSWMEAPGALSLEVKFPDPRALLSIVERVRRMFDVNADPAVIAAHLGNDPLLARPLAAHAGIRTPGAWDGFELAVRAILGQQISVRAATTLAGRVAMRWGTAVEGPDGLNRLFPSATALAHAPLEEAGVMPSRAATIRALARRVVAGGIRFDSADSMAGTQAALAAIPGIGDWTAAYIAMRAFNEPDEFLPTDLILRRVAGDLSARDLERRADAWRPWRAYAVMLLWQATLDPPARATRRPDVRHSGSPHAHIPSSSLARRRDRTGTSAPAGVGSR